MTASDVCGAPNGTQRQRLSPHSICLFAGANTSIGRPGLSPCIRYPSLQPYDGEAELVGPPVMLIRWSPVRPASVSLPPSTYYFDGRAQGITAISG